MSSDSNNNIDNTTDNNTDNNTYSNTDKMNDKMNDKADDKLTGTDSDTKPTSNGLLTTIWGNDTWNSLHCFSYAYPDNPTISDISHYTSHFTNLKHILPCCTCRRHYTQHTGPGGECEINDAVFKNKESLTKWLFKLHSHVVESLGMEYDITYEDVCKKYSSYIANCKITKEQKIIAHKNFYNKEAPIVQYMIAICFADYAKSRGLKNYTYNLNKTLKMHLSKRDGEGNISDSWIKRNEQCWSYVKCMRITGNYGFEEDGKYKNLPTVDELLLLQLMSTTLSKNTINHMLEKLGYVFSDEYVMIHSSLK